MSRQSRLLPARWPAARARGLGSHHVATGRTGPPTMSMRYVREGGSRSKHQNTTSRTTELGRGRGRFSNRGRGRFSHSFVRVSQPGNKWVRSSDGSAVAENGVDPSKSIVATVPISGTCGVSEVEIENEEHEQSSTAEHEASVNNRFERRGRNKLILKKEDTSNSNTYGTTDCAGELICMNPGISDGGAYGTELEASNGRQELSKQIIEAPPLQKQEKNDLVLKKDMKADIVKPMQNSISSDISGTKEQDESSQLNEYEETDAKPTPSALERRGKNKLVLKRGITASSGSREPRKIDMVEAAPARSKSSFTYSRQADNLPADKTHVEAINTSREEQDEQPYVVDVKKRKRHPPPSTSAKGIRRIYLSSNEPAAKTTASDVRKNGPEKESADADKNPFTENSRSMPNKRLTDFAYRDTGRRRRHPKGGGTGNMGLVRVKPENRSETAICPTFGRGVPCNNPRCKLRHDVSSEASRPICLFFQRNGMCSKGDECVFRHVKVRWDAEICPMFEKLGYCEDPDCVLRHVIAKKSREQNDNSR